jgi:protein-S-isoprenylcysteine O-methyltransferase Ste14
MPPVAGLPFSLAAITGIVALVGLLAVVLLLTFAGAGAYSLLALLLPVAAYAACFVIGKRYGEFYAYSMSKKAVHVVKTGAWLCRRYEDFLVKKVQKEQKHGS